MFGSGPSPPMTTALCGVPSWFSKLMTTLLPGGTTSAAEPLVYPLKLNGPPVPPGAPATSANVTVFVAASYLTHLEPADAGLAAPPVSLACAAAVCPDRYGAAPSATSKARAVVPVMILLQEAGNLASSTS